jgi:signal peptidase I
MSSSFLHSLKSTFVRKIKAPFYRAKEYLRNIDPKDVGDTIVHFGFWYGVLAGVNYYGVNFTFCVGPSMLPTLNGEGGLVLIDTYHYRVQERAYKVGDVVIALSPVEAHKSKLRNHFLW